MANTMKRDPVKIESSSANYAKHFNQMAFKGIVHNNNLFEAEQLSFRNAKNVYVNEDSALVSRHPIIPKALPIAYIENNLITTEASILPEGYTLVDTVETGKVIIYVGQQVEKPKLYQIVAMLKDGNVLQSVSEPVAKYRIVAIERYIVAFNNIDAVVLDTDNFRDGWKLLREVAEVPTIKRVVGQEVFDHPANQFTKSYKEEYVWSDDILSILPAGTAEAVVNQSPENLVWELENAHVNTEFRVLRSIGYELQVSDLFSVATNVNTGVTTMCIAREDHFMLSLDEGQSFERILYPENKGFLQIGSVSKDGLCFFMVAVDGVYRYTIGAKTWTAIRVTTPAKATELIGVGHNNVCCFNKAEVFSFVLYQEESGDAAAYLYCKGPGLSVKASSSEVETPFDENTLGFFRVGGQINPSLQLNMTRQDCASKSIFISVSGESPNQRTMVSAWLPGSTSASSTIVNLIGQGPNVAHQHIRTIDEAYGIIYSAKVVPEYAEDGTKYDFRGVEIEGLTTNNNMWKNVLAYIGQKKAKTESEWTSETASDVTDFIFGKTVEAPNPTGEEPLTAAVNSDGLPMKVQTAYIVDLDIYSVDGLTHLPEKLDELERKFTYTHGRNFYMRLGNFIYTNKMLATNNAVLTYTHTSTESYTEVPNVAHVNNELYLAFGNTIKITANQRNGTELTFSLPVINNHAFTSDVTAMINISTTEVAVFLIDRVFLIVQAPDDLFGYRYDYHNTRLSTGVRMGDEVMNTRDGVFTLYPTVQGLAVMNYQALMATTDQVVEYVTKNIIDIWAAFYKAGSIVKMVQMRDYVFLSNGTTEYLMLDLRTMTWWQFDSPVPIQKMSTDQFNLELISDGLYKFDTEYNVYKDVFGKHIEWSMESQPLHFEMPNHYKNMRQLIFQFEESTTKEQTIRAQIKLYRKQIIYKEPEVIGFKVEGYRTFVKRFNYWKINELQWGLASDPDTDTPAQLRLNGITIKFERGEEVRS